MLSAGCVDLTGIAFHTVLACDLQLKSETKISKEREKQLKDLEGERGSLQALVQKYERDVKTHKDARKTAEQVSHTLR